MAAMTTAQVSTITSATAGSPASSTASEVDAEKLRFIEEMTTNVDAEQGRVLEEILARNADAEYLVVNCGLAGATDRTTFRAKVPMVTYEDLEPYIRRIAHGDRSPILSGSGHPISEFLTSSGTSGGERKLIPAVDDELDRRHLLYSLVMPLMNKYVPRLDKGKGLYFLFVKTETTTPGGLTARPVLTSYYKSSHFTNHSDDVYSSNTSPTAAITCEDAFQSMYAQLLCGLCQRRDVLRVGAVFANGLLRAVHFLRRHWEQLAADIDDGTLTPRVTDASVREAVAGVLRPDHELAELIRGECSKGDWAAILTRLWPNAKCLDTIVTGSMAQYVPILRYYSGGLPVISDIYGSSECYFGVNLRPMCDPSEVSYTIMPNMAYFEFLPTDGNGDGDASKLVELAGVEAGREYELVVTNYAGLCRYRVGDVLHVTGFHNAAPQFRYVRRRNVMLSVDADMTGEAELQRAVDRASAVLRRRHGAAVLDYTSRACATSVPGHYVIYWELMLLTKEEEDAMAVDGGTLEGCCLEMEEAMDAVYRRCRVADGSIGPLEIRVVRPGTFEDLMDYAISRGSSIGQYKSPRCVAAPGIVDLLDSRVISSHFSHKLPRWSPGEECSPSTHVAC